MQEYKILKIFNNNVILVRANDLEAILVKKGLGFGKRVGDLISSNVNFEKVYILSEESKIREICKEVIALVQNQLKEKFDEKTCINLIDYITFTVQRIIKKDEIINPFTAEIEMLYKEEFMITRKAMEKLEKKLNIIIPDEEIGFITLHIHTARNKKRISNTLKYAYICNSIIEAIEDILNIEIDKTSFDYMRFIVHLRFALQRISNNIPIKNELKGYIEKDYKNSFEIAKKVAKLIEDELDLNVPKDEISYMAMYIEKIKNTNTNVQACN